MEGCRASDESWCTEGDVPTAANLNFFRRRNSRVGWHGDDEPLIGECGGEAHGVNGRASPVQIVMLARAGLVKATSSAWMVNAWTSFFTVRIRVWNRNGLTSRSAGSGTMLPPVLSYGQGWRAVCQRVRRFHSFLPRSLGGMALLGGILGAPWVSVHMEGTGSAGLPLHVHRIRASS